MLTEAEIAGYMNWRGPGAYTAAAMRKIKEAISEAVKRERDEARRELTYAHTAMRNAMTELNEGDAGAAYETLRQIVGDVPMVHTPTYGNDVV